MQVFTKLASQLTLSKIADLAIIPVLFVFMTAVSYFCSLGVAKLFGFDKPARNFVIAMVSSGDFTRSRKRVLIYWQGVFGNSNSLPISLVMSLANTISGLHWDRIPGDNDSEVAARGILYLLIFQQLGQLLRWSWGYHVLLAKQPSIEEGPAEERYRDDEPERYPVQQDDNFLQVRVDPFASPRLENSFEGLHKIYVEQEPGRKHIRHPTNDSAFGSAGPSGDQTPISKYPSSASLSKDVETSVVEETPNDEARDIASFPIISQTANATLGRITPRWYASSSPPWASRTLTAFKTWPVRFAKGLWAFMNPPLWAMLAAVIVASIPKLQELFFTKGTFINASVTRAVSQNANVAVPLILVVLGANLANSTAKENKSAVADKMDTKILIASLVSRMVLPFIFIAPVLAIAAKYLNISILDDPIFLVVCFLLTGAPSALQLAQICQINNVFEDVITNVLFWSYVVVILPSTLVLVITAIEVVHWAT
jgi:predicted permease